MKNSEVVVGVLGGLAIGAILGVLFAPDKGSNTRRKIAQKGTDLKEHLKGSFSEFISSVEDQYANLTSDAHDLVEEGKEKVEQFANKMSK